MYKMKPCPFCGGSAFTVKEIYPNGKTYWHVLHWNFGKCFIDDCKVTDYHTEVEAVKAWNRRAENETE